MLSTAQIESTDSALVRAVIISLFTWRRADPDDDLPGSDKFGWWGDTYAQDAGDLIGSRLWLLSRSPLTNETVRQAIEYAEEALQWLIDDGVASRISVLAERQGKEMLALQLQVFRADGGTILAARFSDVWEFLKNA